MRPASRRPRFVQLGLGACVASALAVTLSSSGAIGCGGDDDGTASEGDGGADAMSAADQAVLDDARQYDLERVNAYRAAAGVKPLVLDDALDAFAQAASTELAMDHKGHRYFADHASSCGCRLMSEVQGDPSGWPAAPVHQQIDQLLGAMMAEGPGGGHHDAIVAPTAKRLGVGLVNPGGALYFTNDFGS